MKNYGVIFILIALFQLHLGATKYHVSKTGHDSNPGTLEEPFLTISAAAKAAYAGDEILVHQGIYREHIRPPRGGESESKRIVYRDGKYQKT